MKFELTTDQWLAIVNAAKELRLVAQTEKATYKRQVMYEAVRQMEVVAHYFDDEGGSNNTDQDL